MQTGKDHQREIAARLEMAAARTRQDLDDGAIQKIREGIDHLLTLREAMRRVPLSNAEGPPPAFDPALPRARSEERGS